MLPPCSAHCLEYLVEGGTGASTVYSWDPRLGLLSVLPSLAAVAQALWSPSAEQLAVPWEVETSPI